jgi:hypothetical protein
MSQPGPMTGVSDVITVMALVVLVAILSLFPQPAWTVDVVDEAFAAGSGKFIVLDEPEEGSWDLMALAIDSAWLATKQLN